MLGGRFSSNYVISFAKISECKRILVAYSNTNEENNFTTYSPFNDLISPDASTDRTTAFWWGGTDITTIQTSQFASEANTTSIGSILTVRNDGAVAFNDVIGFYSGRRI